MAWTRLPQFRNDDDSYLDAVPSPTDSFCAATCPLSASVVPVRPKRELRSAQEKRALAGGEAMQSQSHLVGESKWERGPRRATLLYTATLLTCRSPSPSPSPECETRRPRPLSVMIIMSAGSGVAWLHGMRRPLFSQSGLRRHLVGAWRPVTAAIAHWNPHYRTTAAARSPQLEPTAPPCKARCDAIR